MHDLKQLAQVLRRMILRDFQQKVLKCEFNILSCIFSLFQCLTFDWKIAFFFQNKNIGTCLKICSSISYSVHAFTVLSNWIRLAGKVTARESTLGSRPLPLKQFETPAPGEYNIDRLDKSKLQSGGCVRGYTFGHPNSQSRSSRLPGNKHIFKRIECRISFGKSTQSESILTQISIDFF